MTSGAWLPWLPNEAYAPEIGRLANPHNDVALLEQALKGLGFEVVTVRDAGLGALNRSVNGYARHLEAAGPGAIGFFYYSGHGASNYLIPVDVRTTETGELWDESLRLTEISRKLKTEAGNATHFVVFDACRNTLEAEPTWIAGGRAVQGLRPRRPREWHADRLRDRRGRACLRHRGGGRDCEQVQQTAR